MEHRGIRVELKGCLEAPLDLGGIKPFLSLQETVCGAGALHNSTVHRYPFDLSIPSTALESFEGSLFRIRYRLTASLLKRGLSAVLISDAVSTSQILWVERSDEPVDRHLFLPQHPLSCLVGTEDENLQVSFSLDADSPANDVTTVFKIGKYINGTIQFLSLQRLTIVSVEVQLVRKESLKSNSDASAILRYQLIDGIPFPGDTVRFRLPIPANLPQITSSLPPSNTRTFSVEYSVAIVLIEEGGQRSYFKQLPIYLEKQCGASGRTMHYLKGLNEPYIL